jgi:hypothetical protein
MPTIEAKLSVRHETFDRAAQACGNLMAKYPDRIWFVGEFVGEIFPFGAFSVEVVA